MEVVHGSLERQHGVLGVDVHGGQPGAHQLVVPELHHGNPAKHGTVVEGGRIPRVRGESLEGRKLPVGHHSEQVCDEAVVTSGVSRG